MIYHSGMEALLKIIFILKILQNRVEGVKFNNSNKYRDDVPTLRIFKGENAAAGQFPYQVALKVELPVSHALKYATMCGGSILSEKKVLSAAHCFTEEKSIWEVMFNVPAWRKLRSSKTLYVVAGSLTNEETIGPKNHNFPDSDIHDINTEQWRRVRKVFVLDKQYHVKLDVAVVFLKHAYTFNNNVASIPLATRRHEYSGLKCLASGYGLVSKEYLEDEGIKQALSLQWAQLSVVPTKDCSDSLYANMNKFVCTKSTSSDVRPGDSGGPLVCFGTGEPKEGDKGILVGIACAIIKDKPSIFTRVTEYLDFINKEVA